MIEKTEKHPLFIINRKRGLLALRIVIFLSLCALTYAVAITRPLPWQPYFIIGGYIISNIILSLERLENFYIKRIPLFLFLSDISIIGFFMFYIGEKTSEFYIVFALVILMSALGRSAKYAFITAIAASLLYAVLSLHGQMEISVDSYEFTTRIAFFFVIALFSSFTAEEVESEKQYQMLFEHSIDGIVITDNKCCILNCNNRATNIFGKDKEKLVGHIIYDFFHTHELAISTNQQKAPTQKEGVSIFHIERKDKEPIPCEISISDVTIGQSSFKQFVIRDVSDLRKAQIQLAQMEKLSSMGRLLSSITHEINNPLTCVIGFAQILKENEKDPQKIEYLSDIYDSGIRCKKIVDDLLSRFRQKESQLKVMSLNDSIKAIVRIMDIHLKYSGVSYELLLDSSNPIILGDNTLIEEVIINMITNACYAMKDSKNKILIISTECSENTVTMKIKDTGGGISKENMPRIFELYFTTKQLGEGIGIGLAISKSIIERHNGNIIFTSEVGKGTEFQITLPIYKPPKEIQNANSKM